MNIAIILAGGTGMRLGANTPKQFIKVLGKPVLAYTIDIFQNHPEIDAIEVVCVKSHIDYMNDLVVEYKLDKVRWVCEGGADFQQSVINGVENLSGKVSDDDIVLIHYGASPFTSCDIITDGIKVASENGNSTSATPCYLLLGSNDDGYKSTKWVDRDKVMQLNTPQCFKYSYVSELYKEAKEKGLLNSVEPHTTSLMYHMNRTIYFSKGNQTNIKITTKEDISMFEGYLLATKNY